MAGFYGKLKMPKAGKIKGPKHKKLSLKSTKKAKPKKGTYA